MKEAIDILKALLSALDEQATAVEELENFEGKPDVLVAIDTAFNELSYTLKDLTPPS